MSKRAFRCELGRTPAPSSTAQYEEFDSWVVERFSEFFIYQRFVGKQPDDKPPRVRYIISTEPVDKTDYILYYSPLDEEGAGEILETIEDTDELAGDAEVIAAPPPRPPLPTRPPLPQKRQPAVQERPPLPQHSANFTTTDNPDDVIAFLDGKPA